MYVHNTYNILHVSQICMNVQLKVYSKLNTLKFRLCSIVFSTADKKGDVNSTGK